MFLWGYGNKIERSCKIFEKFAVYPLWVVTFFHFGDTHPPNTPPHSPNGIIKLRFVANAFAPSSPKVTSRKQNLYYEFGSFLFFIF